MDASDLRPITVDELVDHPSFRLEVLAGASGLEREVQWVHVIDVPDPGGWLSAGELVLTSGIGFPGSADAQVAYLQQLVVAQASGLIVSRGTLAGPLTAEALATADDAALPVLAIPYEVSFSTVTRFVAGAPMRSARGVMEMIQSVHEAALALADGTPRAQETVARMSTALRAELGVVSLRRRALTIGASEALRAHVGAACDAHAARGERLPAIVRLSDRVAIVPVPTADATALIASGWSERPPLAALQHAAVTVAMAMQAEAVEARLQRERLAIRLSAFIAGAVSMTDVMRPLADHGLDDGPWSVASLADTGADALVARCAERDVAVARFDHRQGAASLLIHEGQRSRETLYEAAGAIGPIGVSATFNDLSELARAVTEAELARRAVGDRAGAIRRYGDEHWSPLAPTSETAAREYVEATIGPLIAQRGSRPWMLDTLRAYLDCDRSPSRAAGALGIHRQTLVNRLRRIESTLSRSLADTATVARVWTALGLLDAVGEPSSEPAAATRR
jgi:purine catabolism regulator